MLIFGHKFIESPKFYKIDTITDIKETPSNSVVLLSNLENSIDIAKYCKKNSIPFAIEVSSIKDAIFSNLLNAKYIVSSKELAKSIMPIAQNYLFDSLVLAKIISEDEIEEMAKSSVDGVTFNFSI